MGAAIALQCAAGTNAAPVQIEMQRAAFVRVREFRGDYSRHVEALAALRRDFSGEDRPEPVIVGIYPDDPDAVGIANARWQLGARLAVQDAGESVDDFFRRVEQTQPLRHDVDSRILQPGEAAVLQSTIGNSQRDGLAMLRWLSCSDYAQAGPTRMEYLNATGGLAAPVRIVVPVSRRTWGGPTIRR